MIDKMKVVIGGIILEYPCSDYDEIVATGPDGTQSIVWSDDPTHPLMVKMIEQQYGSDQFAIKAQKFIDEISAMNEDRINEFFKPYIESVNQVIVEKDKFDEFEQLLEECSIDQNEALEHLLKRTKRWSSAEDELKRIKEKIAQLGICPDCLEMCDMDDEGPFSHCSCGTGEDYAKRPTQAMQVEIMKLKHQLKQINFVTGEENRPIGGEKYFLAIADLEYGYRIAPDHYYFIGVEWVGSSGKFSEKYDPENQKWLPVSSIKV